MSFIIYVYIYMSPHTFQKNTHLEYVKKINKNTSNSFEIGLGNIIFVCIKSQKSFLERLKKKKKKILILKLFPKHDV
jgi:hypothetical protein